MKAKLLKEKMDDKELLRALDRLILSAENKANPNPAAAALLGGLNPALKAALPESVRKGKEELKILTQVRDRLEELLEG